MLNENSSSASEKEDKGSWKQPLHLYGASLRSMTFKSKLIITGFCVFIAVAILCIIAIAKANFDEGTYTAKDMINQLNSVPNLDKYIYDQNGQNFLLEVWQDNIFGGTIFTPTRTEDDDADKTMI